MTIAPTLEGGLRIDVESHMDWMLLERMCSDAASASQPLDEKLACHVDANEDWEEFIKPELKSYLSEQLRTISVAITSASRDIDGRGSLFIQQKAGMEWYGALNQARIALEELHNLSKFDLLDPEDIVKESSATRSALIRNQLYQQLQGALLTFVL